MSLEKAEKYLEQLEAIKYYDNVKRERDELSAKVKELKANLVAKGRAIEELTRKLSDLEKVAEVKEGEMKALKKELRAKDEEAAGLKAHARQLESRVKELEELKVTSDGKTLKEAEESFLMARETEIKKRAHESLAQIRLQWERDEKPKEVLSDAIRLLRSTIEELRKPEPRHFPKEVVEIGLSDRVQEIITSEVNKRLDAEFLRRVEESSEKRTLRKLEHLKSVEWPNWYRINVEPRIRELESKATSNAIAMLRGPWTITCDKCGQKFETNLTSEGMESLLRFSFAYLECQNPLCIDSVLLWTRRHRIRVSLKDLIDAKLMAGFPPP
jgi:chromosome segregation ATPase